MIEDASPAPTPLQEMEELVVRIGAPSTMRMMLDALLRIRAERDRLRAALATANETIEDVAVGRRLECCSCGKPRPCICQDNGTVSDFNQ